MFPVARPFAPDRRVWFVQKQVSHVSKATGGTGGRGSVRAAEAGNARNGLTIPPDLCVCLVQKQKQVSHVSKATGGTGGRGSVRAAEAGNARNGLTIPPDLCVCLVQKQKQVSHVSKATSGAGGRGSVRAAEAGSAPINACLGLFDQFRISVHDDSIDGLWPSSPRTRGPTRSVLSLSLHQKANPIQWISACAGKTEGDQAVISRTILINPTTNQLSTEE